MNCKKWLVWILVGAGLFLVPACSRHKEAASVAGKPAAPTQERALERDEAAPLSLAGENKEKKADAPGETARKQEGGKDQAATLTPALLTYKPQAIDRLLHYEINLVYECSDLPKSRLAFLDMLGKYGFFELSEATTESDNPNMTMDVFIRAGLLTRALQDFEAIGRLKREQVRVQDYTEEMFLADQQKRREQSRLQRKANALQGTAAARNYLERETSLAQSEDNLDQAEHKQWKVEDQVKWAKLHINLTTKYRPYHVDVPNYLEAVIGLLEVFMKIGVVLIYLSPVIIIAGIVTWKRRAIAGLFRKRD